MVGRGAGAVGCAHCKVIGATVACRVCKHLVCPRCDADWATCDEPAARVIRLGTTARLRDVDPSGQLGLVSRWRGALRVFDLRRLRWVRDAWLPRSAWTIGWKTPPRLTSTGRALYPKYTLAARGTDPDVAFEGTAVARLDGRDAPLVEGPRPGAGSGMSKTGDVYWYIADTQVVVTIATAATPSLPAATAPVQLSTIELLDRADLRVASLNPLPYKVVQAAHVDGGRGLLASGTWGEVVLHRITDGKLARLGGVKTAGDLRWIEVAGAHLAAGVAHGGRTQLTVWRLREDLSIGDEVHRITGRRALRDASLSRDGRYLAAAFGDDVQVLDLDRGSSATFGEHTDGVTLVQFAGDDHVLITADDDNRVVLRPRAASGYAEATVPLDVPDEEVELPTLGVTR